MPERRGSRRSGDERCRSPSAGAMKAAIGQQHVAAAGRRTWTSQLVPSDRWLPFLFIVPSLLALAIILAYPLGYSAWLSARRYILTPAANVYIGDRNFVRIYHDDKVRNSLKVTFEFAIPVMAINLGLGFGLALLIHHKARAKAFFRIVFSLPILLTPVVVGLNWRVLFNYDFGIVNYYLGLIGVSHQLFLSNPHLAMPTLIAVDAWQTTSFVILVLVAGLAALPEDLFEAARVDGASTWQQIRSITIPLLKPLFLVIILFRTFELLRVFDIVWTLTRGGPGRVTETYSFHIYTQTFLSLSFGYGAAMSYILFFISAAISIVLIKFIGIGSEQEADGGR
jgi:multiple sugar transport system permease protein